MSRLTGTAGVQPALSAAKHYPHCLITLRVSANSAYWDRGRLARTERSENYAPLPHFLESATQLLHWDRGASRPH